MILTLYRVILQIKNTYIFIFISQLPKTTLDSKMLRFSKRGYLPNGKQSYLNLFQKYFCVFIQLICHVCTNIYFNKVSRRFVDVDKCTESEKCALS